MSEEPSISELLRRAGYGHEAKDHLRNTSKHRVYRLSTGETVGEFDAKEAVEFLETQNAH